MVGRRQIDTRPTRRAGVTGPVVVALFGLALSAHSGESMAKTFHLSISGDGGARYSGACTVAAASGDARVELEGAVPLERTFDGDGLSCRFRAEGRVVVEIAHNGSRSRSASDGGTIQVGAR
jgi:hypothetical protein